MQVPTELNTVGGARDAQVPGTGCLHPDFNTGVIGEAGVRHGGARSPGTWHLNALRMPIVKSGRGHPVPGTYATDASYRVQFSWKLTRRSAQVAAVT